VIGRQQQLVRIDFEEPPSEIVLQTKLTAFTSEVVSADLVILSDYAKGSLTNVRNMISVARRLASQSSRSKRD
jgi:bifunctional ADP-heptose synthase (sugar kinase/adenylyltransferase)